MAKSAMTIAEIEADALPFDEPGRLDALIAMIGDADVVLLGEASHGTAEFYAVRAELSKRLIREKGFRFIAVEGDWPSCHTVNRYVKYGDPATAREALRDFNRWPTWMWANENIVELAVWMRAYNSSLPAGSARELVGFYGLDVYSLWESMDEIVRYLERVGSEELERAKRAFSCFEPYGRDEQSYGVSAGIFSEGCEDEVVRLLAGLQKSRKRLPEDDEAAFDAEMNALAAVDAERYYRTMVRGGPESWNVRDRHMVEALRRIRAFYGPGTKAIVWEHNTHIGDARATDMAEDGMVNVGQLLREDPEAGRVFAVGFGTHRGTVIAGCAWGAPMEEMEVPPAQAGSWEDAVHRACGGRNALFRLGPDAGRYRGFVGHRAIGVVYNPGRERYGNYVPTVLADRYDAFVHLDETRALRPIAIRPVGADPILM